MIWFRNQDSWLFILRQHLPRLLLCSLAWEVAQLPLYSLWFDSSWTWIAFSVAHCTAGDGVIGTAALVVALTVNRAENPADWPRFRIGVAIVFLAVAYTVLSERINLARGSWGYSPWMPVLPWIDVGLAPLLQWIVVPSMTWWWASRHPVLAIARSGRL
jgi:hypothetical protein